MVTAVKAEVTAVKAEKNLMAATWTPASLVRRAFNAGPRRRSDRQFEDVEDAVLTAYTSFRGLRGAMKDAELPARDVRAALVLMSPYYADPTFNTGTVMLLAVPDAIKGLPALLDEAEKHIKKDAMLPLGVAFWQRDKDPRAKSDKTAWVQLWLVDPRAQRAADAATESLAKLDGRVPEDGLADTFEEN